MTRFKCLSCGGKYDDVQRDGSSYYHVCPPGTENLRDENPDPNAPRERFSSERGEGYARSYCPKALGLGRVEVREL